MLRFARLLSPFPFISQKKKKKNRFLVRYHFFVCLLPVSKQNFIKMVRFIIFVYEFKRVEKPFTVKTSETLNE
jgi:hypothetical protein